MSRHRNVRNYAYEDEMSEDVYGHSVEEYDMCISPSTAQQFMYNRGNNNQQSNLFSNYMSGRFGSVEEEQEEENSEDEDHLSNSQDYRRPQLDPISEAKLSSCLDQLQSVLGDDCHEPTAVDAILKYNFDAEKALDYIFSKETKKDSSQKKTTKKQDSSLHHKLLKKNLAKSEINQRLKKLVDSQPAKGQSCSEDSICRRQRSSLLSLPLSSIISESRENSGVGVKCDVSKNQPPFTSLGSLMTRPQRESSSLGGMPEMQSFSPSQDPLLSVSLKTLSEEQKTKQKSFQESCFPLRSLWDNSNSGDLLGSTSLSSLAKQHDGSGNTGSLGLSGVSLQDLAQQNPYSVAKTRHSSEVPMDMLGSASLSSLAKQHDESVGTGPLGLSGVSLGELAQQNPYSVAKTRHSSEVPLDMLGSASLSSLTKQHDESRNTGPLGLSGVSLQELAQQNPSSPTEASKEPVDTRMLTSTSLSSLARQHDDFPRTKPFGISEFSLQDLAKQMPPAFTSQDKHFPMDQGMSSQSIQPTRESYRTQYPPGQNTRNSIHDSVFATSLSDLASLSLDSNASRKKSLENTQESQALLAKKNSAIYASSILSNNHNSRTLDGVITLQTERELSTLNLKQSKKKERNLKCEENLLKVSPKSMKKKRTHKISQSSMLLMNPSMFARTLCCKTKRKLLFPDHLKSKRMCSSGVYGKSGIAAFDFVSLSPDDIIRMKQQQRFGVQRGKQKT